MKRRRRGCRTRTGETPVPLSDVSMFGFVRAEFAGEIDYQAEMVAARDGEGPREGQAGGPGVNA